MSKRSAQQLVVGLTALVLIPFVAEAQTSRSITVEYADAPLTRVAEGFASFSGRAITIAPGLGDLPVTGVVRNLDWNEGLDRLLGSDGLVARADSGGGLRIERERRVTVDYEDVRLSDVVREVSAFSHRAIVIMPGAGDPLVSASVVNEDWQRGLDRILARAGLVAQADSAGVLRVQSRTPR